MKGKILIVLVLISLRFSLIAQVISAFTDERDGQVYETVTYEIEHSKDSISTRTWMAQNLNFKVEYSYCYDDYNSNCEIMGRMYSWATALEVCPTEWHLPSDEDWYALADLYGGVEEAGRHLKSTSDLWVKRRENGTNKSLFNAMPYGHGISDGRSVSFGLTIVYWSSSDKNEIDAWDWALNAGWNKINRWEGNKKEILNFVRCVKD